MFTILGGDGKEYGPANAEQIKRWIESGRANLETKAKAVGTEEWKRLGDFAEFAAPSSTPPVMPAPSAAGNPVTAAAPAAAPAAQLAERGQRLLARVIDWVIEGICATPGFIILGREFFRLAMTMGQGKQFDLEDLDVQKLALGGSVLFVSMISLLVVQVWMLTTRGQSIGKRIVGIRVVRQDGSAAGIVYAWLMRELLITAIGVMASIIPFLGILLQPAFHLTDWCMIFSDDQRCLHDRMAGTKVVKV